MMKNVANEIFGIFEKYKAGNCTYDRALEDAGNAIKKYADERPIVGYVKSGTLTDVFRCIILDSKPDPDRSYQFDCKIHKNTLESIKRMEKDL